MAIVLATKEEHLAGANYIAQVGFDVRSFDTPEQVEAWIGQRRMGEHATVWSDQGLDCDDFVPIPY